MGARTSSTSRLWQFFLLFAVLLRDSGFTNPNNLMNILRQTATITVMAVAMTYVIAAAEIDLSVGSIAGLSSVVTAMSISSWGLVPGIMAGLSVGLVAGCNQRRLSCLAEGSLVFGDPGNAGPSCWSGPLDYGLGTYSNC